MALTGFLADSVRPESPEVAQSGAFVMPRTSYLAGQGSEASVTDMPG